ncbi:MAG TPA: hypothetical protein DCS67_04905 [Clostridiales bacterium UBA8960]|nr:hypothetical protein [Clostridiales bacterium UBA8960]
MKKQTIKIIISLMVLIVITSGFKALQINLEQQFELVDYKNRLEQKELEIKELMTFEEVIGAKNEIIEAREEQIKKLEEEVSMIASRYETVKAQNKALTDKVVYLTFDDGPSKSVTLEIVKILETYDVKATFFVQGRNVEKNKEVLKIVHDSGHVIGNHSFSHNYAIIYQNETQFWEDFNKAQDVIFSVTGSYPEVFRFPGGSLSAFNLLGESAYKNITKGLLERNMQHFDWNIDSGDAASSYATAGEIKMNAFTQLAKKKHAIVLFHDTDMKLSTVEALPAIIEHYLAMGYRFDVLVPNGFTHQQR